MIRPFITRHTPNCSSHTCYCLDDFQGDPMCDCGNPAWACRCEPTDTQPETEHDVQTRHFAIRGSVDETRSSCTRDRGSVNHSSLLPTFAARAFNFSASPLFLPANIPKSIVRCAAGISENSSSTRCESSFGC